MAKKLQNYKYKYTSPYRNIVFQRKRIKISKSKEQLHIPIDALARALYVFDHDPLLVYKGPKYFFDTDEQNGMYWQIFGDNGKKLEHYNEVRLTKTVSVYFIWTRIEEKLKATIQGVQSQGRREHHVVPVHLSQVAFPLSIRLHPEQQLCKGTTDLIQKDSERLHF